MNPGAVELAEAHLGRARNALADGDETAAVLWGNLCAEIAVAHVAELNNIDTRKDHFRRASIARRLFEAGLVPDDLTDLMIRLNNERKHGVYEGRSPDLRGRTWQQIFRSLERLIRAAAAAEPAS